MKSETFSGTRGNWIVVVIIALAMVGLIMSSFALVVSPSWSMVLSLATCVAVVLLMAVQWRNRIRPPLEITDEEILYAPQTWVRPRHIPLRDIESIESSGERRAVLHLHSGERLILRLGNLEAASRKRAVSALNEVARTLARP
jgi:hypothetical protein